LVCRPIIVVIMENERKKLSDRIDDIDWSKLLTWTTLISISAIAYYSLGALKHWKELKKIK
jgi:hypothetical protein